MTFVHKKIALAAGLMLAGLFADVLASPAQTADQAWLRHGYLHGLPPIPLHIRALGRQPLETTALTELVRAVDRLFGSKPSIGGNNSDSAVVLGTVEEVRAEFPRFNVPTALPPGGFWISGENSAGKQLVIIAGGDERGTLYGAFALIRTLATSGWTPNTTITSSPAMPIRWVDEWDNPDGSIERGYAGRSIFFDAGHVRDDLTPVGEYARLLGSIGINGCNVNNVNAAPQLLDADHLKEMARIADAMRPWGVRLAMSVDIASPQRIGGLATYDPLDAAVKQWWTRKANEIYRLIPDFAGFTVKADSEGQPGPASFGRTPADAANTLAAALAPHGGVVLYRAFVYNHHLDWNDPKADRARAAYDIFHPLDGQFAPNVIVQIKYGPIDFQAREPVSPLFGGLRETNEAMEVQITQEYTGQQRHLVYLAPMWKEMLDFDLDADNHATPVKDLVAGKTSHRPFGGMVGVACVGRDAWLGSPLALANLYAFGRLAWDPSLTAEQIAIEWTRQTLSNDPDVVRTVTKMLMQSWPAYEHYTGTLGLQTLTDITGSHYGPNIESSERNGWGQWHRADHDGVGMDRTVATGTGFIGQYPSEVAAIYESLKTCPDNLLLFFHHVPYTYRLHFGKTVIQSIYDDHYSGAEQAAELAREWDSLKGRINEKTFEDVRARLVYQAGHAIVWRDAIVQYFLKLSGISDDAGRAGHYPGRLEAEDAHLTGYKVVDVTPWEDASRGKAVVCNFATSGLAEGAGSGAKSQRTTSVVPQVAPKDDRAPAPAASPACSAEWAYSGQSGRFDIAVQYFDLQGGVAKFALDVNGKTAATWSADAALPSRRPNGDNSTRFTAEGIDLKPGDVIRVVGTPDGADFAALDYIEIEP